MVIVESPRRINLMFSSVAEDIVFYVRTGTSPPLAPTNRIKLPADRSMVLHELMSKLKASSAVAVVFSCRGKWYAVHWMDTTRSSGADEWVHKPVQMSTCEAAVARMFMTYTMGR